MAQVILGDSPYDSYEETQRRWAQIDAWSQQNCPSYLGYTSQDVSDVSLEHDELAAFDFRDEKDVTLFILKWKT